MYLAGTQDGSLEAAGAAAAGGGGGGGGSSTEGDFPLGRNLTFLMSEMLKPEEGGGAGFFTSVGGGAGFSTGFGLSVVGKREYTSRMPPPPPPPPNNT